MVFNTHTQASYFGSSSYHWVINYFKITNYKRAAVKMIQTKYI